ncbi:MAG: hypothetical protein M3Q03_09520 [Chloroflexota bacterium]|nr:hypothetical protein [Chloroflexota bacterium]
MTDVEARVSALCAAPAGCTFLLVVEASGLTPSVAARPAVAVHLAAVALAEVTPWRLDHERVVAETLRHGPRLAPLARGILTQPDAAWWFAPLNHAAQLWVPWAAPKGDRPDPERLVTPASPPDHWERYAQKSLGALYTSTIVEGTSSALAALTHGTGDHDATPPLADYRLHATENARVFEVDGPGAWHRLCTTYPASGQDGRLVPDWAAVARDWDAVHLTLGGALTAERVRVEGPAGWTEHSGWEAELIVWLRWQFEAVEHLPDLPEPPKSPASIVLPPTPAPGPDHVPQWVRFSGEFDSR